MDCQRSRGRCIGSFGVPWGVALLREHGVLGVESSKIVGKAARTEITARADCQLGVTLRRHLQEGAGRRVKLKSRSSRDIADHAIIIVPIFFRNMARAQVASRTSPRVRRALLVMKCDLRVARYISERSRHLRSLDVLYLIRSPPGDAAAPDNLDVADGHAVVCPGTDSLPELLVP